MATALFHTHPRGKLLLSGEYFVLDGALSLALPTRQGQQFEISAGGQSGLLTWESLDSAGNAWFSGIFNTNDFEIIAESDLAVATRCQQLLRTCRTLAPNFLQNRPALQLTARLEFPRLWGLGTSSTLVAALAQWAQVNAYDLLQNTFGGSGYDLACAHARGPILYQRQMGEPLIQPTTFCPPWRQYLYFVYLGHKQNSREGIALYREKQAGTLEAIQQITAYTEQLVQAKSLGDFAEILRRHEHFIAAALGLTPAKTLYFPDFDGEIKSLGAWGGDFVLAASARDTDWVRAYFFKKGYSDILTFDEMIFYENS